MKTKSTVVFEDNRNHRDLVGQTTLILRVVYKQDPIGRIYMCSMWSTCKAYLSSPSQTLKKPHQFHKYSIRLLCIDPFAVSSVHPN
ncbi:hypothetical protein L1887_30383 [Cichorium endivia]|nr:hypothetical protein L1887_30383 [Cichorium endivia]